MGPAKQMPLGAADDRRRDADHTAGAVDQRAATVAGIERGIGLDNVLDQAARHAAQRAAQGVRRRALITPVVTVAWSPSGLPIATTS
jgi:hypothetical protein